MNQTLPSLTKLSKIPSLSSLRLRLLIIKEKLWCNKYQYFQFFEIRLKINIEGCKNNLNKSCTAFYENYGGDGRNHTARAVYECFFDPNNGVKLYRRNSLDIISWLYFDSDLTNYES